MSENFDQLIEETKKILTKLYQEISKHEQQIRSLNEIATATYFFCEILSGFENGHTYYATEEYLSRNRDQKRDNLPKICSQCGKQYLTVVHHWEEPNGCDVRNHEGVFIVCLGCKKVKRL